MLIFAALLALAQQQFEPFPPTPFDRVIPIVIDANDAVLAGHGHAERVTYKAEFSGTLHLWTKSAGELDLLLRVETPSGELVHEDDNSGGGKTPYVKLEVEPGRELVIVTAVAEGEGVGSIELRAIAAPETAETHAAADAAKLAIDEITRLREARELEPARQRTSEAIDACLSLVAGASSELVASRLLMLGFEALSVSIPRPRNNAWSSVLRHRLRTLPDEHPELQAARGNLAITIRELGDLQGARALEERVLRVRSKTLPEEHPDLQMARQNLAVTLQELGDIPGARALLERVLEVRERTLPEEHPDLQMARQNLAVTIRKSGDLRGARAMFARVLEVYTKTLPEEHPDLQSARLNLAWTIKDLGDLQGARSLEERVLEVLTKTLPEENPRLQRVRQNLAVTIKELGDLQGARVLEERVLEIRSRTLPEEHPDLQRARLNLAVTIEELGDLQGARALLERVLDVFSRTLPEEHPDLQMARQALAGTLEVLGDLQGALALKERVLEVRARTLPEEHRDLQAARLNLAVTIGSLGDLQGARALVERVLEVFSKTLPEDHPDLQKARENLAVTVGELGDLQGARALKERVLEVRSRTLPEEHPDLQSAQQNLAVTLKELGDLQGARVLFERVLEVRSRTLSEEHPHLQSARQNLAATLQQLGDLHGARTLEERVLEVRTKALPEEHPDLQRARQNLAVTIRELGDLQGARTLLERVLEVSAKTLPDEHPDLQLARVNLALTALMQASVRARGPGVEGGSVGESGREECARLLRDLSSSSSRAARAVRLSAPGREAEERCTHLADWLGLTISAALGYGGLDPSTTLGPAAFEFREATRNAAVSSSALGRRAATSGGYSEARTRLRSATDELARLVQAGTHREGYRKALAERDEAERALLELGRKASGGQATGIELDLATLSAALDPGTNVVAYSSYPRWDLEWSAHPDSTSRGRPKLTRGESLCAFVVRPRNPASSTDASASLTLLDLGPIVPIRAAIMSWRDALGVGDGRGVHVAARAADPTLAARGAEIRRLVFDPLRKALGDAQHVVVVLDGELQLVPLDALPAGDDDTQRLGDTLRIETRTTLGELLDAPLPLEGERVFVGLGGAEFDGERAEAKKDGDSAAEASAVIAAAVPAKSASLPSILRGGAFGTGFSALPGTLRELEGLEHEFTTSAGADTKLTLLRGKDATKQALLAAAPRARWLHIATHGWFAPESIRSWEDRDPIDAKSALAFRQSGEETVKGMSPMLLCGLALAGANLPEDAVRRAPGLLTADELSTLDLSNCELAVLSACDTARGEMRRAGQGVASLQKALQIAGARSVITSLWKVPDEATKDLMLDFYRRLWVDKKPKWQALWEAKLKLRNAKDERGEPKYTTRDWAAWVLTGEPE